MDEPFLPDHFYVQTNVKMVVDGQHVLATVKKWYGEEYKQAVCDASGDLHTEYVDNFPNRRQK